ncbi:hypothetical protein C8R44DRAFT_801749 [Mycena epipterygia]|nr:hypothetical protein C8R44DRAFT_801749 [Mycena epipterygia]
MPPSSPSFSPSFQIIVIPPAEDQEPDYLVFKADDLPEPDLATNPDFASLDDALARMHTREPPPTFTRTSVDGVVMPRRSADPTDLADETVRDDSEIVEVVKVRRAFSQEEPPQPPPPPPKHNSLRSRASRAFRSIKNVARARSSSHSRPYAQDMFASSQSTQATFASASAAAAPVVPTPPPPPPPPRVRRGSIILSQLFRAPSPARASSATLDFLASDHYSEDDEDDDDDDAYDDDRQSIAPRAPSPSPSARTFSSTIRRRLSTLNFQRKAPAAPPPSRPSSPPTLSRGSTVPSASSSAPQTPTEEVYPHPLPSTKDADDDPDRTIGEMRLDSLHFESLSFDADNF